ncbi:hypothetical protein [Paenibacillus amylolyticus]|uniref:hypothetical protein n=1 Tax=Paenibacillus amylolyticus TaxID=1451 RepID=UPI003EC09581
MVFEYPPKFSHRALPIMINITIVLNWVGEWKSGLLHFISAIILVFCVPQQSILNKTTKKALEPIPRKCRKDRFQSLSVYLRAHRYKRALMGALWYTSV